MPWREAASASPSGRYRASTTGSGTAAEFLAELHDLTPVGQLRYTAGVLSADLRPARRAGLHPVERRGGRHDDLTRTPFYWRCRVLRTHHWVGRSTEDGGRYEACSRCGKEREDLSAGGPNTAFPIGGW